MTVRRMLGLIMGTVAAGVGCGGEADIESETLTGGPAGKIYVAAGSVSDLSFQVKLAGRSQTTCADGTTRSTCPLTDFDYTALALGPTGESWLDEAFREGRALFQGNLEEILRQGHPTATPTLVVAKAWMAAGDGNAESGQTLYLVEGKSSTSWTARTVNSTTATTIHALDLVASGATAHEVHTVEWLSQLGNPGLILRGTRTQSTLNATYIFFPLLKNSSGDSCETSHDCVGNQELACSNEDPVSACAFVCVDSSCAVNDAFALPSIGESPLEDDSNGPRSCVGVECGPGKHCEMGPSTPVCVDDDETERGQSSCVGVTCASGKHCEITDSKATCVES